ncbi:MAG: transcription antitermination factor NusB [Candidatus Nanopelagicales bacterium]
MNSREAAYQIIEEVEVHDAYLNLILPRYLNQFSEQDARFITELVSGVYRNRSFLDFAIASEAKRDLDKVDPPLRDILRIGAYQVLFMRTENYAAVSETVNLVSLTRLASARGFVNATLRKLSEHDLRYYQEIIEGSTPNTWERLSLLYSHPLWIVKSAAEALFSNQSDVEALLQRNNEVPSVTLVSRDGILTGSESLFSPYAMRVQENPYRHPLVLERKAQVQDEGSQVVAQILGHFPIEGTDSAWLDLCSGPGGKAMLLKQIAAGRNAKLTAIEVHSHRAELVEEALRGIDGNSVVEIADGRDSAFATGKFDRVLVDAPCLGLGALRRRAESRWRKKASDLTDLVPLQKALLENALKAVRPGGVVGYVTCSWHLAESDYLVADIVKAHPDVEIQDINQGIMAVPHLKRADDLIADDKFLRLWPHKHDTDGMFMAVLKRH